MSEIRSPNFEQQKLERKTRKHLRWARSGRKNVRFKILELSEDLSQSFTTIKAARTPEMPRSGCAIVSVFVGVVVLCTVFEMSLLWFFDASEASILRAAGAERRLCFLEFLNTDY